jgi:hypothetical protein
MLPSGRSDLHTFLELLRDGRKSELMRWKTRRGMSQDIRVRQSLCVLRIPVLDGTTYSILIPAIVEYREWFLDGRADDHVTHS